MPIPIAMVAGEASGDLLASLLLGGLAMRLPEAAAYGIGGERMVAQGFRADWPMEKLAVRGYVEVLRHYREIAGIRRQLCRTLIENHPAAFIGVDAPDFNLDLEIALRREGIVTIHFVSPSIWAWRASRIRKIARAVDHMLVLFPFEESIYRDAGIDATYVGHPLADVIPLVPDRAQARRILGLRDEDVVAALLPGSRLSEIRYIAPSFIEAAKILHRRQPGIRFVIPTATDATRTSVVEAVRAAAAQELPLTITSGQSHEVMAACDAVLVASGTASLEAALFKRPMVIAYRMARVSWWMMRHMGYQPWVGLPNILAREFLVPEFLQDRASPLALADALQRQLFDEANRVTLIERFTEMHHQLRCNTAVRAAEVVADLISRRGTA